MKRSKIFLICYGVFIFCIICNEELSIAADGTTKISSNAIRAPHIADENICASPDKPIIFPIKGKQKIFSGNTKNTAPKILGDFIIANESNWYYEWPIPKPIYSYDKYKNYKKIHNNQEPGYRACRPTIDLPNGCGRPHEGIDIYSHYGTPIIAPEDGDIISYSGSGIFDQTGTEAKNGGSGRLIRLLGKSGCRYTFMHIMGISKEVATSIGVSKDFRNTDEKEIKAPVNAGDIIGYVGNTGGIVNPHLHFEVTKDDIHVDPNQLMFRRGSNQVTVFPGL